MSKANNMWKQCVSVVLACLMMPVVQASTYKVVEFQELLPEADFRALMNPPKELADIEDGSLEDRIASAIGQTIEQSKAPQTDYERALQSTTVRSEFNNQKIRIPGFIVPLEFDDKQVVTEFFLVPYFGACIHLPPPPPNQIILVKSEKGVYVESIYDAYWVEGTLTTELVSSELATSAYKMTADRIEMYLEP